MLKQLLGLVQLGDCFTIIEIKDAYFNFPVTQKLKVSMLSLVPAPSVAA